MHQFTKWIRCRRELNMRSKFRRTTLGFISLILTDSLGNFLTRIFSKRLRKESLEELTDECLEFLLRGMELAFYLSRGYRRNIQEFKGAYLLKTRGNLVAASVTFDRGKMKVHENAIDHWDVRVTFKDVQAFWRFVFSQEHDILNLILANEVEIDGNLNYIYKFGFLARDLAHRIGF
jgi:hypothetical protein